ncbi:MAG TPA: DUF6084 family protein [Candidatus Acidoferrum sp.]|jgi:Family of unknown function (DUF6084)|nr:DUF6084 family protein [Candidatus Acidoferrum sp.]
MPDLRLTIENAEVVQYAAAPLLTFKARITNDSSEEIIHTVALRAQIQIEVIRRKYDGEEQARLMDLFGAPDRWGQTLRNMLWTHASVVVPRFTGSVLADIQVPCTFDFNIAATKYFHGLTSGDLPLCFQFSGTVFYQGQDGTLQVAPISWDKEAKYRLPLKVWKDLMDMYYPNSAWLALQRDTFEKLYQYKVREGIPTWEEVLERALNALQETVRS